MEMTPTTTKPEVTRGDGANLFLFFQTPEAGTENFASDFSSYGPNRDSSNIRAVIRTARWHMFGNFAATRINYGGKALSIINAYTGVSAELFATMVPVPSDIIRAYDRGNREPLDMWAIANYPELTALVLRGKRRPNLRAVHAARFVREYYFPLLNCYETYCDTCKPPSVERHEGTVATTFCIQCGVKARKNGEASPLLTPVKIHRTYNAFTGKVAYCDLHAVEHNFNPLSTPAYSAAHCDVCVYMETHHV